MLYVVHTTSEIAYASLTPITPPPGFQVSEIPGGSTLVGRIREVYRVVQGRVVPKCVATPYHPNPYVVADGTNQLPVTIRVSLRLPGVDAFTSVPLLVDGAGPIEVALGPDDEGIYPFTTMQAGEHVLEVPSTESLNGGKLVVRAVRS